MAVTLTQISQWLDTSEVKHKHDTEKERIVFGSGDEETTQSHFIRTQEDGEIFQWQMQILDDNLDNVTIKDHPHAAKVIQHALYMNYNTKFGTWEYDPTDGDIRLAVEIPLEDAEMTEKQFERIKGYMIGNGASGAKDIRHILKTGEMPANPETELLSKLEALMALLQDTGASEGSSDGI